MDNRPCKLLVYSKLFLYSSHRELLRMKWSDYQMYIKEKTDEVATSYYSSLKHLHQDVPLAEIPSLKTQHIETFNPYKVNIKMEILHLSFITCFHMLAQKCRLMF